MQKYKYLFFDLDHTIWDFEENAKQSLGEIFGTELQQKLNTDFDSFFNRYSHHNIVLWDRYERGFIGVEELKWKRMYRAMLDFKIADEELSKDLSLQFLEILPTKKEVFPHCFEVLSYLKEKNYELHLITNGFEKVQNAKLQNSGLHAFFDKMITSESSNSLKPKPEIFDYAMQTTGANINESIMIGDNQHADIKGALDYGMDAVFVNHINEPLKTSPTHVVTHLKQLQDIF
jgi:putative hydrolase of the HAD superfamily